MTNKGREANNGCGIVLRPPWALGGQCYGDTGCGAGVRGQADLPHGDSSGQQFG